MAHKRSGAKRRAARKAREQEQPEHEGEESDAESNDGKQSSRKPPTSNVNGSHVDDCQAARPVITILTLRPDIDEVIAAVATLYMDGLKPFGRILRKRIIERHLAANADLRASLDDNTCVEVDMFHLLKQCKDCDQLTITSEEGGDWSAVLNGCTPNFVDVYSSVDTYDEEMWRQASQFLTEMSDEEAKLPGGRYSCAQSLLAMGAPFLNGRGLGEACHIVQLAISQRKLLGYLHGAVVPYRLSQSMIKADCASQQKWCGLASQNFATYPLATWDSARIGLKTLLDESAASKRDGTPGVVPLSNIKRVFRARFQTELSETALGHCKLSQLLHDPHFADLCTVDLDGQGYMVTQISPSKASTISLSDSLSPVTSTASAGSVTHPERTLKRQFWGVPLDDAAEAMLNFTPFPSPDAWSLSEAVANVLFVGDTTSASTIAFQTPRVSAKEAADQSTGFCVDEPLCMEDSKEPVHMLDFGPTPYQFANYSPLHEHEVVIASCDPGSTDRASAAPVLPIDAMPKRLELSPRSSPVSVGSRRLEPEFCKGEPLVLEDASPAVDLPNYGLTPCPLSAVHRSAVPPQMDPFKMRDVPSPCRSGVPSQARNFVAAGNSQCMFMPYQHMADLPAPVEAEKPRQLRLADYLLAETQQDA